MRYIKSIIENTDAASAIEYCLILGLVSVAGLTVLGGVSDQISSTFDLVSQIFRSSSPSN